MNLKKKEKEQAAPEKKFGACCWQPASLLEKYI